MDKSYPYVHVYILRKSGICSKLIYTGNISFISHLLSQKILTFIKIHKIMFKIIERQQPHLKLTVLNVKLLI